MLRRGQASTLGFQIRYFTTVLGENDISKILLGEEQKHHFKHDSHAHCYDLYHQELTTMTQFDSVMGIYRVFFLTGPPLNLLSVGR